MAVLPFVVQPKKNVEVVKIGNEEVGILEVERKGYLSVAEKAFVDAVMQNSDGVSGVVQLANKLAGEFKTTPEKAYIAISEAMTGSASSKLAEKVIDEYPEEIASISSRMAEAMQRRAIAATTILIQTRINHEWTLEDTMKLDPVLVNEFVALYDKEEQRVPVEKQTAEEEAADIVGK